MHVEQLETYLVGKNLYQNEVLEESLKILNDQLHPDNELLDAAPEYRRNLAISLFYKFVLGTAPVGKVSTAFKSGADLLKREISSGTQEFDRLENKWPVSKRVVKVEANIQCTGEALYTNDFQPQLNELYAAFVLATKVHGKILTIDPSKALEIDGVTHFYSAKDIPGKNNFMPLCFGFNFKPEEILCSEKVLYNGQPLGIILANTYELANYACTLVEVVYEESGAI